MHEPSATPIRLLDGGLSTQLERLGHTPTGTLWTAEQLLGNVETIVESHRAFVAAGAEILITSSYQLSHRALADRGVVGSDADAVFRASTEAARAAAESAASPVSVAASVGPYGATLADGSEYVGTYDISYRQLRAFHQQRLEVLIGTAPDLLAIETIPSLQELEAIAEALGTIGGAIPAWWSLTPDDSTSFRTGEDISRANEVVAETAHAVAIGVNCASIETCLAALNRLALSATAELVIYPNAGGSWNAATRQWEQTADPQRDPDDPNNQPINWVQRAVHSGATIIGGCCGTDAAAIAAIGDQLSRT